MTGLEIVGAVVAWAGALGLCWVCWAQRLEIERLRDARQRLQAALLNPMAGMPSRHENALEAIAAATATGKSGTARKVHRMATEVLDG